MQSHYHSRQWLTTFPSVSVFLKLLQSIVDSSWIHQVIQVSRVVLRWSPPVFVRTSPNVLEYILVPLGTLQQKCFYDGSLTKRFCETNMSKTRFTFLSLFVGQPLVHFLPVHRHLDQDQFKEEDEDWRVLWYFGETSRSRLCKEEDEDWRVQLQLERQR